MDRIETLKEKVLASGSLTREEACSLLTAELDPLCAAADTIRRHFCGNTCDLCSIINGKSGRCPEDCRYCAQSAHYAAPVEEYPLLGDEPILKEAQYNHAKGVGRFAVVTSGRRLTDEELDSVCASYRRVGERCGISLCASHGLLSAEQLVRLRQAGVTRYHNNLETSRRFFPYICTTHTYDDKLRTIRAAQEAGLQVCSGGIFGLGETWEDRIDMALELRELGIRSVPLNLLNPIPGTPLAQQERLTEADMCRAVAIYRFLLPRAALRLAGGRGLLADQGRAVFLSGANAAITGDMLTTAGVSIDSDRRMLHELGFEVTRVG